MSLVDKLSDWLRLGEPSPAEYKENKVALTTCPRCRTRVLTTLDGWLRQRIMVNAVPVNAVGEAMALANRRATYRLYGSTASMLELIFRNSWDIYASAPGSITESGIIIFVVIEHDCRFTMLPQYIDGRFLCQGEVLF